MRKKNRTMPPQKIGIKEVGKLADALTQIIGRQKSVFTKEEKEKIRQIRDELNKMLAKKIGGKEDDEVLGLQDADKPSDRKKD